MARSQTDIAGGVASLDPIAVSPREACRLLSIGNTRLYELIAAGEVESYRDGKSRRVTMRSIRRRVERLLAAGGTDTAAPTPPRRRGRPPKPRRADGERAP
jgi:excisionase family DNA binding protein